MATYELSVQGEENLRTEGAVIMSTEGAVIMSTHRGTGRSRGDIADQINRRREVVFDLRIVVFVHSYSLHSLSIAYTMITPRSLPHLIPLISKSVAQLEWATHPPGTGSCNIRGGAILERVGTSCLRDIPGHTQLVAGFLHFLVPIGLHPPVMMDPQ